MGYDFNGGGELYIKHCDTKEEFEKVRDCVEEILNNQYIMDWGYRKEKENLIDITIEYQSYRDEELYKTLAQLKPYIEDGEIECTGEDGEVWRFIYRNPDWYEENGYIAYDTDHACIICEDEED